MESKLLALRKNNQYEYEIFPHDEDGARAAVGFLEAGSPPIGAVYRLEYHTDKHGDTMPRSTKIGEI